MTTLVNCVFVLATLAWAILLVAFAVLMVGVATQLLRTGLLWISGIRALYVHRRQFLDANRR